MLIGAATLVTVIGVIGALAWLNARDDSDLDHSGASAPGRPAPELTDRTLEQGNVIFRFADPADRAALRSLAQALVNAGQAILVQRGDALGAEAYKRRLTVSSPDDPALTQFVEYWLGRNSLP
jgi:hypothetical protein